MPFINIINININTGNTDAIDANELIMSIEYMIEPLNLLDKLQIKVV